MQESTGPRPFDTSLSYLIELDARGWLDWLGFPVDGPVQSIESDAATVLAEVDKVLRIAAPSPWLAHIEVQASHDPRLSTRLLQYHALLLHRHGLPVETTVVLLRPDANSPELDGHYQRPGVAHDVTVSFRYRVIRLWERPLQEFLDGSIGVLPLAPLAAIEPSDVPPVIERLEDRVQGELDPTTAEELWNATLFLLRLRYDENQIRAMVQSMSTLRENPVFKIFAEEWYKAELAEERARAEAEGRAKGRAEGQAEGRAEGQAEGQAAEARRLLIALGSDKLGTPDAATVQILSEITDVDRLERLVRRILTASTWQDLLSAEPGR